MRNEENLWSYDHPGAFLVWIPNPCTEAGAGKSGMTRLVKCCHDFLVLLYKKIELYNLEENKFNCILYK
jgi:hypothetical protein